MSLNRKTWDEMEMKMYLLDNKKYKIELINDKIVAKRYNEKTRFWVEVFLPTEKTEELLANVKSQIKQNHIESFNSP